MNDLLPENLDHNTHTYCARSPAYDAASAQQTAWLDGRESCPSRGGLILGLQENPQCQMDCCSPTPQCTVYLTDALSREKCRHILQWLNDTVKQTISGTMGHSVNPRGNRLISPLTECSHHANNLIASLRNGRCL